MQLHVRVARARPSTTVEMQRSRTHQTRASRKSRGFVSSCKEFSVAAFNPSGESVVLGNYNRFLATSSAGLPRTCAVYAHSFECRRPEVFAWHPKRSEWAEVVQREAGADSLGPFSSSMSPQFFSREVPNLYSVTALSWRADGSRLIVGSLCGGVDMFDVCIRRSRAALGLCVLSCWRNRRAPLPRIPRLA